MQKKLSSLVGQYKGKTIYPNDEFICKKGINYLLVSEDIWYTTLAGPYDVRHKIDMGYLDRAIQQYNQDDFELMIKGNMLTLLMPLYKYKS